MIDIKQYLEQTNTVLLTKDAFEYLKERASVPDKVKAEYDPSADLISREKTLTAFADYVGSGMSMDDYDALWNIVAKMPAVNPQPCEDAISRQAVLDVLDNHKYSNEFCEKHHIDWSINLRMAHIAVNDLPPVTPRQKYGKWIKQTLSVKPFGEDTVLCDQCAFMTDKDSMYNYCPNCGAKMVEPQESEE